MTLKKLDKSFLFDFVANNISKLTKLKISEIDNDTFIMGDKSVLKSSELFDFLLDLEIFLEKFNINFEWSKMIMKLSKINKNIKIKNLIEYINENKQN